MLIIVVVILVLVALLVALIVVVAAVAVARAMTILDHLGTVADSVTTADARLV